MTTYRSTDVFNVTDTTTGTPNARVKRRGLCVQENKLKEFTASTAEYKCTNCMTYNKYKQTRSINEDHSSLDKVS